MQLAAMHLTSFLVWGKGGSVARGLQQAVPLAASGGRFLGIFPVLDLYAFVSASVLLWYLRRIDNKIRGPIPTASTFDTGDLEFGERCGQ